MCGIFCSIHKNNLKAKSINIDLLEHCNIHLYPCAKLEECLARRGPDSMQITHKDLCDGWTSCILGSVLWTQGTQTSVQPLQDDNGNILLWNGDLLYGPLEKIGRCDSDVIFENFKTNVLNTVINICGPYAFVFWESASRQLWFGRDVFGRHSLLWDISLNSVTLSSTGHKQSNLTEVPALGIYKIDLSDNQKLEINIFPWAHLKNSRIYSLHEMPEILEKATIVHYVLGDASTRESWLGKEPKDEDLRGYEDPAFPIRADKLVQLLSDAIECRVAKQPGVCKECKRQETCTHCRVAVLFSGGLDSTVLALLAHRFIPNSFPLDLYNVAFQQSNGSYNVPDRITGWKSYEELKILAPNRVWNFIEVDVSQNKLAEMRQDRVADLIHPLNSVLDDSIGCALWFAASGQGFLNGSPYSSPARIVLLGMGADEQLGGYIRHRNTLKHTGQWATLGLELVADTDNISRRNLGRDNRVVSDHGRQPRTPFLDEKVVAYINSLAPWHRCLLTRDLPPGVGDKLLLRLAARQLGLTGAASLPKRALQFGSRIANRKEKGSQLSNRL